MRDLPTGIVTFLFTDIEGSTRLLERLGERYRGVQQRHDEILRDAIQRGHGREVSTEGDAFFAVFHDPNDAVLTAVSAQRSLAATAWPDLSVVRVRMGLHTGEGFLGGDDYLGLDVNRTARIASAAHGGQVLISDATRVLVERTLPVGTRLGDLGQHRLKDLSRPEHLHQIQIEGLEQDFPPPRTLEVRVNNIPGQLTRFIGRGDEISRIRDLLAATRLLTLTGPGGTGKTRLGLEVAAALLPAFRDGVWFVDLSGLTDAELVAQEIADGLRLRVGADRLVLDALKEDLRDKELLLMLDNFEQVIDAGQIVVEPLLRTAPGAKVLATSRVPLHLYGEREYAVPPLGLPDQDRLPDFETLVRLDAVALFAERATAVKPDFRVTPRNARAVAGITARLDGLPLAIELAASRVKVLSPEQLLIRLAQRLPILTAQDRNVPERQRTLRKTIDWSYDLLDEPERRMFWRVAAFVGGANLEAVDFVANPLGELGLDTLDGLTSLVDKNLVRRLDAAEGESRFGMLETIREYGLGRLSESGEEPAIRRRQADHWIQVAEQASAPASGAGHVAAIGSMDHDHDNFRAALGWALLSGEAEQGLRLAIALREYWRVGSHFREGVRWIDDLLALPAASGRTRLRARALTAAADLSSWMGQTDGYLRRAEDAVAMYREIGDAPGMADALSELGVAQMTAGQFDAARATLVEARDRNTALGDRQKAGECTVALGFEASLSGRPDESRGHLEDALATFMQLGDPFWSAFTERWVGWLDQREGEEASAERRYRSSLAMARTHDIMLVVAMDLYAFGDLALARGQYERALCLVGASQTLRDRIGDAPSLERAAVGDVEAKARAFVDATMADGAYQEGRDMDVDEAVTYALG